MPRAAQWALFLLAAASRLVGASLMDDCNRAWQFMGQHRDQEAITLLQQVIAREPTYAQAYAQLVKVYIESHRLEDGERYFASLSRSAESGSLGHYGLGRMAVAGEHFREAA